MPVYVYKCEFGHFHEEYQSIKEFDKNRVVECTECGNTMETYIGEPPLGFVRQEITTVGQLGEKNWKGLGKTRQQEAVCRSKELKESAHREVLKEKGLPEMSLPDYSKVNTLAGLNRKQRDRYIATGKLPPKTKKSK